MGILYLYWNISALPQLVWIWKILCSEHVFALSSTCPCHSTSCLSSGSLLYRLTGSRHHFFGITNTSQMRRSFDQHNRGGTWMEWFHSDHPTKKRKTALDSIVATMKASSLFVIISSRNFSGIRISRPFSSIFHLPPLTSPPPNIPLTPSRCLPRDLFLATHPPTRRRTLGCVVFIIWFSNSMQ